MYHFTFLSRPLFLYFSNGEDIVAGAGGDDNTLKFWKIFNTLRTKGIENKYSWKLDGLIML